MKEFRQAGYAKPTVACLVLCFVFGFIEIMGRVFFKASLVDALSGNVFKSLSYRYKDRFFVVNSWYSTGFDYCVALDVYYDNGSSKSALVIADHPRITSLNWTVSDDHLMASVDAGKTLFRINLLETDFNNFKEGNLPWRSGSYTQLK